MLCLAVLVGCSNMSDGTREVAQTYMDYFEAAKKQDIENCAKTLHWRSMAHLAEDAKKEFCLSVFRTADDYEIISVIDVIIRGDSANATMVYRGLRAGEIRNATGSFAKVDGNWKINLDAYPHLRNQLIDGTGERKLSSRVI